MTANAPRRLISSPENLTIVVGTAVVATAVALVALGMDLLRFDVIVGILTVLALTLAAVPALRWVANAEGDPSFGSILVWAWLLKIVGTLIRYFVLTVIYHDNGDAGVYTAGGAIFMEAYRKGRFIFTIPELESRGPETMRIAIIVGFIYMITGASRYAASFVFAGLCFTGQILMYRAFRHGVPESEPRRYALLLLFIPSMLFWPSSVGKEALMVFFIGIVSYGAAVLLTPPVKFLGLPIFMIGAGGLFFVRPHMALIAIAALGFANAVSTVVGFAGEKDKKASSRSFAIKMVALVVLIGAAGVATTQLGKVLGDGTTGADGISGVLARTKSQTGEGGSQFEPPAVAGPADLPNAIVTVLFRPFPWEAHSLNSVIAAGEGLLLGGLLVVGRRRVLAWARALRTRPYLVFAAAFALIFIVAFSYIGNFGILARQRTQMLPLALTLLGLSPAVRTRSSWFGGKPVTAEPVADASSPLQSQPSLSGRLPRSESQ